MLLSTNQHQLNFHKKNVLIFKSRMLQTYDILFPARHKLKSDFKYPPPEIALRDSFPNRMFMLQGCIAPT